MSITRTDLWPLALHEAGHVLAAFCADYPVDKVYVGRPKGYTIVTYSMNPESLARRWAQSPMIAAGELAKIIGVVRAGALYDGAYGLDGHDLESMAQWRDAYVAGVGTAADWNATYAAVYSALLSWRQRASVQATVKALAQGLLHQGTTSKEALMDMLALAGAHHTPEPYYRPVLPAPQRAPAPVVSMAGQRRALGQMDVDLQQFARDERGHVRPLTPAEWRYVKAHGIAAVAHHFTDAELQTVEAHMAAAVARQEGGGTFR